MPDIRPRAMTLPGKRPKRASPECEGSPTRSPVDDNTIPKVLIRSNSIALDKAIELDFRNESKVLVLYTGGTIGMVRNAAGVLVPAPNAMEANIRFTSYCLLLLCFVSLLKYSMIFISFSNAPLSSLTSSFSGG